VELDPVAGADERVQLALLAVHGHSTGLDQLVRAAPRVDPGSRKVGVQPHGPIIRSGALHLAHGEGLVRRRLARRSLRRRTHAPTRGGRRTHDLPLERLGLPGLCLLVGLMAAVVYVWPALLLAHFLF